MEIINRMITAGFLSVCLLCGCTDPQTRETGNTYKQISQGEAREMMDTLEDCIIADVRTVSEFEEAHIPGALNIPVEHLEELADELLPDQEETILIYCRSGNRSVQAAEILVQLGYTNVYEFGGINTWPYETVSEKNNTDLKLALGEVTDLNESGVSFTVVDYHDQVLEMRIENHSGAAIAYGAAYTLDILADGEYRQMEWKEEPVWIMVAYELQDGESSTVSRDLSMIANLGPGSYRMNIGGFSTEFTLVSKE